MYYYAQTVNEICCGVQSSVQEIEAPGLIEISEQEYLAAFPLNRRRADGEWQELPLPEVHAPEILTDEDVSAVKKLFEED